MAERTQAVSVARQIVKRAQQKALAKDAATILVGIRKAARGVGCSAHSKKKGKKSGKHQLAKTAAVAIVAIKSGNKMQKQAAIGDLLKKILPLLAGAGKKVVGGAGKALGRAGGATSKALGGAMASPAGQTVQELMAQPLTVGTLAGGAGAAAGGHLLAKTLGKERIDAMQQGAVSGLTGGAGILGGAARGL